MALVTSLPNVHTSRLPRTRALSYLPNHTAPAWMRYPFLQALCSPSWFIPKARWWSGLCGPCLLRVQGYKSGCSGWCAWRPEDICLPAGRRRCLQPLGWLQTLRLPGVARLGWKERRTLRMLDLHFPEHIFIPLWIDLQPWISSTA